jgi:hypothetical protein
MNSKQWVNTALLTFLVLSPFGVNISSAQVKKLTAAEANNHIGEQNTACGNVASTRYAATTRGNAMGVALVKGVDKWGFRPERFAGSHGSIGPYANVVQAAQNVLAGAR